MNISTVYSLGILDIKSEIIILQIKKILVP